MKNKNKNKNNEFLLYPKWSPVGLAGSAYQNPKSQPDATLYRTSLFGCVIQKQAGSSSLFNNWFGSPFGTAVALIAKFHQIWLLVSIPSSIKKQCPRVE